jgi:hypothetical protein
MTVYVLIGLALSLAGVAGLQFFYLVYLERIDREQKKRIRELEHHCKYLSSRVKQAERQIVDQNDLLESFFDEFLDEDEEEVWADVIEEK